MSRDSKVRVSVMALVLVAVVTSGFVPFFGVSVSPVQPASAAYGFEDCDISNSVVLAFYNGFANPNEDGTCRFNPTDTETVLLEETSVNETYDEVLRVTEVRDNEERLIDSLLSTPEFAKNPVRDEAELVFAQEWMNGSTETEAITASTNVVHGAYDERVLSILERENRDVRNARDTYAQAATYDAEEYVNVYVRSGGETVQLNTTGGVTFDVPTSIDDSANGTSVDVRGQSAYVATVTVDGTTYDYRDGLAVTMEDPAGEQSEVPIVGYDYLVDNDPIVPDYTEDEADLVVDVDVTDPASTSGVTHNDIDTAITDASEGDVIFLRDGTHSFNGERYSKGVTLIGESKSGTIIDATSDFSKYFELDGSTSDTPVMIRDLTFNGDGSSWLFGYFSGSSAPEAPAYIQNIEYSGDSVFSGQYKNTVGVDVTLSTGDGYRDGDGMTGEVTVVGSYVGQYHSFTDEMIAEQESDRTEILTAFGDSSSGYFSDVWAQLETGVLSIQDILTYEQMFSQSFSEEDVGSIAFIDSQYMQAGMSSHASNYTVVVEAQTDATVYANAQKSQAATVSEPVEYRGHMWTMSPPAGGAWEANTTYDTEALGSPVYVTYYKTTTQVVNGSVVTDTAPATVAIEGEFRVTELLNKDAESVSSIEHSGTPSADPYDPSVYADDIEQMNQRIGDLQQQLEDFTDSSGVSDGGDGGDDTDACGIELPLVGCTGVTNASVSLIAVAIIVLGGAYVLGPALRGLGGLLNR